MSSALLQQRRHLDGRVENLRPTDIAKKQECVEYTGRRRTPLDSRGSASWTPSGGNVLLITIGLVGEFSLELDRQDKC